MWRGLLTAIFLLANATQFFILVGATYAEWVLVAQSVQGVTVYMHDEEIHQKGDTVRVWNLYDYRIAQSAGGSFYLSATVQEEYDCIGQRVRTLAVIGYPQHMGNGDIVFRDSDMGKWEPIVPDSLSKALSKLACAKK